MKTFKQIKTNRGMTYLEIIVVLSIFAVLSSVAIFNYGAFQSKVDIKNLAGDVALKIVEAQKSSLGGLLPPLAQQASMIPGWKPSYGLFFYPGPGTNSNTKKFVYFVDLNNNASYQGVGLNDCTITYPECLNSISISKNNYISGLDLFCSGDPTPHHADYTYMIFLRPNSGAIIEPFTSANVPITCATTVSYIQVTVSSPDGTTAAIKLYPSGRVEIK